jgi:phosphatidate cytidylyltransferase
VTDEKTEPPNDDAPTPEPNKAEPETKKKGLGGTAMRFATALPLIPIIVGLMFWEQSLGFQIFGAIWTGICAHELMTMAMPDATLSKWWGVVATLGVSIVIFRTPDYLMAALLAALFGTLVVAIKDAEPIDAAAGRIGWMLGSVLYLGVPLGALALLQQHEHGGAWVLLSMFVAFLSDTGAYFAGRFFGKHKLSPKLSPKKTIEGSIGGLIAATAGALVLQQTLLTHVPLLHIAILAPIAAAFGQAGDLLESLLKRSCGVKDSGKIMPGHGGLLDRSDALLFTSTAVFAYVTWLAPLFT